MRENVNGEDQPLPPGWARTMLGEIAELVGGGTPSRAIPEFFAGDIVWLTPTEIPKDRISVISDSKERITAEGLQKSSARLVPGGTVLMTSRASIGFVAIAGTTLATNQGFANFICEEGVYNLYLAYWLWANADFFEQQATGTTFKEIIKSKLRTFALPLAPLPEQHRIIAKIEELFSDLDAGVAALKRVRANLKRYRASVLKDACEGRLVPTEAELAREEGRAYEPANDLLKRILAERRVRWEAEHPGKKYVEPAAPETDGLPELPEGWCWARVEQLAEVARGASPRPAGNPKYFGGDIPWITVGYLTADEQPYLTAVTTFVTEEGRQKSRYVGPDTLLLTNSGATLGVPKITKIGGCFNHGVVAILHVEHPLKLYLYYFLKSMTRRLRAINQGAAQPNLNTGIVNAIVVPLAPSAEQHRLVAEVERRLSVVAELEATVAANLARAARLRQAVLKRAFEGRLVAQDPSDVPAEALPGQRVKGGG